jgi:ribosomal protein S18 acetylase RimI-like enzyme
MSGRSGVTVRRATTEDVSAIHRVAHETWPDTYDDVLGADTVDSFLADYYSEESLRRDVRRDEGVFLVADPGDAGASDPGDAGASDAPADGAPEDEDPAGDRTADAVGYAEAGPTEESDADADSWTLGRLYVLPAWQGDGVGSALLDRVEAAARDAGVERLRLVVLAANDPAVAFYEAAGYRHAETRAGELAEAPERVYRREL